jgi:hypothetical protein
MKINNKIFTLPPYISTSWVNINALYMKGNNLVVTLNDGDSIIIPQLKPEVIESIFNAHSSYLEEDTLENSSNQFSNQGKDFQVKGAHPQTFFSSETGMELPFRFGFGPIDGLALQHNPAQANSPEIPNEILTKIGAIAKIISPEEINSLPKPEPHCNCMHCQIARTIHGVLSLNDQGIEPQPLPVEDTVGDEELVFQQWDISQSGDNLFTVINRLDTKEKYSVYLGHPIGCTCGKQGCEHILAVLKS